MRWRDFIKEIYVILCMLVEIFYKEVYDIIKFKLYLIWGLYILKIFLFLGKYFCCLRFYDFFFIKLIDNVKRVEVLF